MILSQTLLEPNTGKVGSVTELLIRFYESTVVLHQQKDPNLNEMNDSCLPTLLDVWANNR